MDLLFDGPADAPVTVVLGHGAGTPMDHPFLKEAARGLGAAGHRVVRFEFPYMAGRRVDGKRRAPDKEQVLLQTFKEVVAGCSGKLVVGGKSMGGRMASMIADDVHAAGLIVFGYPFHPPGNPERLRVAHLKDLRTPGLIIQGSRDPFGTREDVAEYALSDAIAIHWIEGGGHDLAAPGGSRSPGRALEVPLAVANQFLELIERS